MGELKIKERFENLVYAVLESRRYLLVYTVIAVVCGLISLYCQSKVTMTSLLLGSGGTYKTIVSFCSIIQFANFVYLASKELKLMKIDFCRKDKAINCFIVLFSLFIYNRVLTLILFIIGNVLFK